MVKITVQELMDKLSHYASTDVITLNVFLDESASLTVQTSSGFQTLLDTDPE